MNEDISLACRDCQKQFVWSAAEQAFYKEKGLLQPKRCKDCRRIRRAQMNNGTEQ